MPLQQDPAVQPSTLLGNPQRGDVHKEGDPLGRVQLGTLVSPPSPIITCNTGKLPVSTSDQLVAALGSAGVVISRSIADRIMGVGVGGAAPSSVQVGAGDEVTGETVVSGAGTVSGVVDRSHGVLTTPTISTRGC